MAPLGRGISARRRFARRTSFDFANNYTGIESIPEIASFADAVAQRSDGGVRIRFRNGWAAATDPQEEVTLALDVARGRADLGWVGSRVFGKLGVTAFDPLETPFLLRSHERQRLVLESGIAEEMLGSLQAIGLVGLAILPGEQRKPFGFRRPFVETSDFEGAVIQTHASAVSEATYAALGASATPDGAPAAPRGRALLDGMDLHPSALAEYGFTGFLTWNVNLWPRMPVIVMNRDRFAALPVPTQDLLRAAAADTVGHAISGHGGDDGRSELERQDGLVIVESTEAQLAGFAQRVEIVRRQLLNDAGASGFLQRIEAVLPPGDDL